MHPEEDLALVAAAEAAAVCESLFVLPAPPYLCVQCPHVLCFFLLANLCVCVCVCVWGLLRVLHNGVHTVEDAENFKTWLVSAVKACVTYPQYSSIMDEAIQ